MFLQTLMNVELEGIAVPMTLFALTWMVGMTVDVPMARTAQETVSMKAKSSTTVRFGCWRMTDALSAHARSVQMEVAASARWWWGRRAERQDSSEIPVLAAFSGACVELQK